MTDVAEQRGRLMVAPRARAILMGLLGLVALVLGVVGVSATAEETVRRRLRDAAIRVALGASSLGVVRRMLAGVMATVAIGMTVGFLAGVGGALWARHLFYGVLPDDPTSLAGAAIVIAIGALLAAGVPARRAATVDPVVLLRDE